MNWKIKSATQRVCARIPFVRQPVYRQLQRGMRVVKPYDPSFLLSETVRMAKLLRSNGHEISGSSVMEIGTGWRLDIPIGLYICGARQITTCDLNRYLEKPLVFESVRFIREHKDRIRQIFLPVVGRELLDERLAALDRAGNLQGLLKLANTEYCAPCDCSRTTFQEGSFDLQISYTVLEHISGADLEAILIESNRLLSGSGVAYHHIDLSDHFEQVDSSITKINFLQFTEEQWAVYAGTPWSYHNRLREDEYRVLFDRAQHEILHWSTQVDERSMRQLESGFGLESRYRHKPPRLLSTVIIDAISRPVRPTR